jgi:anti-anti-sigma regulatory factor
MIVRMTGEFDSRTQAAIREGFNWITNAVTIDLENAYLAAGALGEILRLANRIGIENVKLANPTPMMRKILATTHLDRVLDVINPDDLRALYKKSA